MRFRAVSKRSCFKCDILTSCERMMGYCYFFSFFVSIFIVFHSFHYEFGFYVKCLVSVNRFSLLSFFFFFFDFWRIKSRMNFWGLYVTQYLMGFDFRESFDFRKANSLYIQLVLWKVALYFSSFLFVFKIGNSYL